MPFISRVRDLLRRPRSDDAEPDFARRRVIRSALAGTLLLPEVARAASAPFSATSLERSFTFDTATGTSTARTLAAATAKVVSVADFGAVADGKKTTTNVSMMAGQPIMTVSDPIFSAADVNKHIGVIRQDVHGGWSPWYGGTTGYATVAKIIGYNSPRSVTLDRNANGSPPGAPTYPAQSWPYSSTPSIVMWGTDNSPAFQAALNAGGTVLIPAGGAYCLARQLIIASNTVLQNGGAWLYPLGVVPSTGTSDIQPVIVNSALARHWAAYESGGSAVGWGKTASLRTSIGDRDIHLRSLWIDMSMSGIAFGGIVSRFFLLERGSITGCHVTAPQNTGYEGPNLIGCDSIEISGNHYENTTYGFTPWGGCTNIKFDNNTLSVPKITNGQSGIKYGSICETSAIQVNVVGTSSIDQQISSRIEITNNNIYLNGIALLTSQARGIMFFPDGCASVYADCKIDGNRIYCTGSHNSPIFCNGGSINLQITDNQIEGADGSYGPAIQVSPEFGNRASSKALASVSSTSGSPNLTVRWPNHGYTGENLGKLPAFFYAVSGVSAGGITVTNHFQIVSVPDTNTLIIKAGTNARSTQTVAWQGSFAQVLLAPIGATIARNKLKDCAAIGTGLIKVMGTACTVQDNVVVLSNGAATGNYLSIILWSGINNLRSCVIANNSGPPGRGSLNGYAGNNRVAWNTYEPPPVLSDTGGAGQVNVPSATHP